MTAPVDEKSTYPQLSVAADYLDLAPEQRYVVISQRFPSWLISEPIVFPMHEPTYGWACLVNGCNSMVRSSHAHRGQFCALHFRAFNQVMTVVSMEDFLRDAKPLGRHGLGWALYRKRACTVCGSNREAQCSGYCPSHWSTRVYHRNHHGTSEEAWRRSQHPLPPYPTCSVPDCVHDGDARTDPIGAIRMPICVSHREHWKRWFRNVDGEPGTDAWHRFVSSPAVRDSVTPVENRGRVSLGHLPIRLQREIRYGIYRHANTPRRCRWQPRDLQRVADALAEAQLETLSDPAVCDLAHTNARTPGERRIWIDLPIAARSLSVTADTAKSEGWFDPIIVGGKAFSGSQGQENRRKVWSLNSISQRWLRDILWENLRDETLKPAGKRGAASIVYQRIAGISLLSLILRQTRADHGNDPTMLSTVDARAVKNLWDLWYSEQVPIPTALDPRAEPTTLSERSRQIHMSSIRSVLNAHRKSTACHPGLAAFILALPEYAGGPKNPRPRPLSYEDFQLLVNEDSLRGLDAVDTEDIGLTDIWLAQAFQGGRVGETLKLRLGCIGLFGAAQPYIWRDISKINVVDYGMPCNLPVYQRLLRRQSVTRSRLRARYAQQLASLDETGRARLEEEWDRTMPLFPSRVRNPDLSIAVSYCGFRTIWTQWFEGLGLSGITTHQTRATLATSLLNNGAPAALVRQLLGHISDESLAHYARYNDASMIRHLQQVWAAGPGTDKPGAILLRPGDLTATDGRAITARIDLSVVPVEYGLCRYGPVVGGKNCPFNKNCTTGPLGPCEHFVLTGADLAYWERKREAAFHFAEGAPTEEARDYILSQWHPWEPVLAGLRQALDELGLLEEAEQLDLRSPAQDYFNPLFSAGWAMTQLNSATNPTSTGQE
jgi:integrase